VRQRGGGAVTTGAPSGRHRRIGAAGRRAGARRLGRARPRRNSSSS
jgi:hypothetical protein